MIRLSKMSDYSVVVLVELTCPDRSLRTASDIASVLSIPEPTVTKVLKMLAKADILHSARGVKGGYALARPAAEIRIADIIEAVEGPIALTSCATGDVGVDNCIMEGVCSLSGRWAPVNRALRSALQSVSLSDLMGAQEQTRKVSV